MSQTATCQPQQCERRPLQHHRAATQLTPYPSPAPASEAMNPRTNICHALSGVTSAKRSASDNDGKAASARGSASAQSVTGGVHASGRPASARAESTLQCASRAPVTVQSAMGGAAPAGGVCRRKTVAVVSKRGPHGHPACSAWVCIRVWCMYMRLSVYVDADPMGVCICVCLCMLNPKPYGKP